METVIENLHSQMQEQGWQGQVVSIERLADLREGIEGRHAQGLLNEEFYQERLKFFTFAPPEDLPGVASIIVVAVPRPQTRVRFTWNQRTLETILPPTYAGHIEVRQKVHDFLTQWLAPQGYHVTAARLPQKLLAVQSGLADYGRNNIGYIQGMGSFFQPTVFFSDMPCPKDTWREARVMDRCHECHACLIQCPTGAITAERFLIQAERCLVFHNERPPDHPFPAWIDATAHHCLIGCMRCQQSCPENKPFLNRFEGDEEFSNEETLLLLEGAPRDRLPPATLAKLERLTLTDDLNILPRNLSALFGADGPMAHNRTPSNVVE